MEQEADERENIIIYELYYNANYGGTQCKQLMTQYKICALVLFYATVLL